MIGKWAMSLDGRVATAAGMSRWISSEPSRAIVHELRGRMDGILCGIGTALADDPLLTARPAGARQALRIVLDTAARLPIESRLVHTAREVPVLVATGPAAPADRLRALASAGCEIWQANAADPRERLRELLAELGSRRLTNVLVEGGPTVLGSLADAHAIDEVWAFIAPTIIGGAASPSPIAGTGIAALVSATAIEIEHTAHPGGDLFIRGVVKSK
jgi:diaminohydroxyphosphoribosylaminopyrimidine deaminase/5-amino-6-(5-phosphoribosylamino)uracil reductase